MIEKRATRKPGYLPTLDGWRAVAILAVIFHHDGLHILGPLSTRWLYQYGSAGVDVFFAISGILICSRLLAEEEAWGRIDLRQFYQRRCRRILPPAFLYLATIAVLHGLALIPLSAGGWWSALLFCRNYPNLLKSTNDAAGWYTSHFWSLSLEEQFYLLLPAILVLTARKYRATILFTLAAAIAAHRWLALGARSWLQIQFHAGIRLDALLVPALFAVLASSPGMRPVMQKALRFWPWIAVGVLCIIPFGKGTALHASALVWLMPCVVLGSVLNPQNALGKFLEWRPLRAIGRMSYSLYLWQQLFFRQHFVPSANMASWQSWPLRLVLTFCCALISYRLLEVPLAAWGRGRIWAKPPSSETRIASERIDVRIARTRAS
jgi:peptidoglycan/LPS O-acetylase OafA/YrhL